MPNNDNLFELKAEIKELRDDGTFSGIASVYGVEDLTGDVIEKGAFRKTISENPEVLILWQHRSDEPIGMGTVKEWQNKILIEGRLDIDDDETARKAYSKLKKKRINGLSIGFQTVKAEFKELEEGGKSRYVRHIQELKLFEVSVVTFPALPAAQVTRVKSEEPHEIRRELEELKAQVSALLATQSTPAAKADGAAEGEGAAISDPEPTPVHSVINWQIPTSLLS